MFRMPVPPSPQNQDFVWYKWFKDVYYQVVSPTFRVYRSTDQTGLSGAGANHKVQFNTVQYDTYSNFDEATNYRFTCTIPGYYGLTAVARWNYQPASAGFTNILILMLNTSTEIGRFVQFPVNGVPCDSMIISTNYYLRKGDYVEVFVSQTSGGNQGIAGGNNDCLFMGHRLGA